jgi:hypothetical protein
LVLSSLGSVLSSLGSVLSSPTYQLRLAPESPRRPCLPQRRSHPPSSPRCLLRLVPERAYRSCPQRRNCLSSALTYLRFLSER